MPDTRSATLTVQQRCWLGRIRFRGWNWRTAALPRATRVPAPSRGWPCWDFSRRSRKPGTGASMLRWLTLIALLLTLSQARAEHIVIGLAIPPGVSDGGMAAAAELGLFKAENLDPE